MSDNALEPIVNAIFNYYKWFKSCWVEPKIDFNSLFKNMKFKNIDNVYPELVNQSNEEYYRVFEFNVPLGFSIEDFKNKEDVFAQALNVNVKDLRFEKKNYNVIIKARNSKKPVFIFDEEIHKRKGFKIPIGIELDTLKLRYWDISDPANAHCYIAGGTRCGKSTVLRLIMSYLVSMPKCDMNLDILNEKIVDLIEFKDCKNVMHYTENLDETNDILDDVIEEMNKRYKRFGKMKNVKNIWDYRKHIQKMPIRIVVIEELSSYVNDKEFHNKLKNIASRGAAAGVFLLLTAQLPNKDVLPNLTKQNINTVIGGKCKDSIRSDIIVEDGELQKLRGKGHMKIFDSDDYGTEIQALWIDDSKVDEIANRYKIKEAPTVAAVNASNRKLLKPTQLNK